ncbi:MAG: right-handed parallel beta-helix repeat-containing protein [Candidatus Kapabacteria bacterium]|nr:right-handed parallel beta-helix repeat-containing protein [Candidatus Kapabacteria bacterium]
MNKLVDRFIIVLLVCTPFIAFANTYRVGATRTYTVPSAVSPLVNNGDTVLIDAGEYVGDVCSWRANNLLLRGEGLVILRANGKAAEQKAIWVVKGNDCVIDGIDFRDCAVPDRNGAGIRVEGTNITVQRCAFRKNQDGILAGDNRTSTITVEYCEFDRSGAGDGLSHAIYVNHVRRFIFRYNYSHGTLVGHEFKSRALETFIAYNRISNEDGTGSRNIDLPNGGTSVIIGNVIQHGPNAENGNVIGYGLEGMVDTVANNLTVAYNTIVNERSSATFIRADTNTKILRLVNNLIAGNGTLLIGDAADVDTLHNLRSMRIADVMFTNAAQYDYRLLETSPARLAALDVWNDLQVTPTYSYRHVTGRTERRTARDLGAYESDKTASVDVTNETDIGSVTPLPASSFITLHLPMSVRGLPSSVIGVDGRTIAMLGIAAEEDLRINVQAYPPGLYTIVCGRVNVPFIVAR